jgi:hypothetical protein
MPMSLGAIFSFTLLTALLTPLPRYLFLSPSRNSKASLSPVEAPEGTAARPKEPLLSSTSTSTVGLPRESRISLALIWLILISSIHSPSLVNFLICSSVKLILNAKFLYYFDIDYLKIAENYDMDKSTIKDNYDILINYLEDKNIE